MADQITDPTDGNSPSAHDDSIAPEQRGIKRQRTSNAAPADDDDDDDDKPGRERRKIEIKFIQDKSRRHITFSKRKAGIMKKVRRCPILTRDATCRTFRPNLVFTDKLQIRPTNCLSLPVLKSFCSSCLRLVSSIPSLLPSSSH